MLYTERKVDCLRFDTETVLPFILIGAESYSFCFVTALYLHKVGSSLLQTLGGYSHLLFLAYPFVNKLTKCIKYSNIHLIAVPFEVEVDNTVGAWVRK